MDKRVDEIREEINHLSNRFKAEKEKFMQQWVNIQSSCTHPDIGEVFMFVCPDCGYDGGPSYPEELGERDYENYSINNEKTRLWSKSLKVKYSKIEITNMVQKVK